MRIAIALLVVLVVGLFLAARWPSAPDELPVSRSDETLRTLDSGAVVGFVTPNGSYAWRGLPFAKPPVGELRWKAPLPAEPWEGTREALQIGALCPQFASLLSGAGEDADTGTVVGDEDCLYLNVWAPAKASAAEAGLPVMVWIHGGGNSIGHGGSYDGSHLAKAHDLVVITINYRLGPFGWFRHPALRSGNPADDSGNYGTLDIVAVLHWVRDNVSHFGGDPSNVTIFGESAGGADVLSMIASPLAEGLFQRAIVQSGGLWLNPPAVAENYVDDEEPGHKFSAREVVNGLLVAEGAAADRDAAKTHQEGMQGSEIAALLRGKSAEEILNIYNGGSFGMISAPEVFGDGHVLPEDQIEVLFQDRARYNDVPVILGSNRDEPKLFMVRNPSYVENRFWIFPRLRDEAGYLREAGYQSEMWKARGVDGIARRLRETQGPTVFAYRFDWDEEPSIMGYDLSVALGAAHGLEIAFVFGNFEGGLGLSYIYDEDRLSGRDALSRSMMSYWAEFAYSGNPGQGRDGREPAWLPWGTSGQAMIVFDTPQDRGIRMSSDTVTATQIRGRLVADASFASQRDHCQMYARLFNDTDEFIEAEWGELGGVGCKDYNPAELDQF